MLYTAPHRDVEHARAEKTGAGMDLLTNTREIYWDQPPKSYWENVNTIVPWSCNDKGKRGAETMMYSYYDQVDIKVRVAQIFNMFGPRMHLNDGR